MSNLDDYIYMLRQQGYSVMFSEYFGANSIRVRLSKNGLHLEKYIPYDDMLRLCLDQETIKMNVLMEMRKELDKTLEQFEKPRWNDYQAHTLTDISDRLVRYGEDQTDENLRTKLRSIATEIKNVIPMGMVRRNGG